MAFELKIDIDTPSRVKTAQIGQYNNETMIFKNIRDRLANWADCSRGGAPRGGECMTNVVCSSLRRAALGEVWSGHSGRQQLDHADGDLVERSWKTLAPLHKELLRWHYIRSAPPGLICRRLGIKPRPTAVFDLELRRAEVAIEAALAGLGQFSGIEKGNR